MKETSKSKKGLDIELDEPTIESIYEKLKDFRLNQIEDFFNKPIEAVMIDKEVDNESLNSNGIGQTNYVLKIRFL